MTFMERCDKQVDYFNQRWQPGCWQMYKIETSNKLKNMRKCLFYLTPFLYYADIYIVNMRNDKTIL